jgi:hypothetical protein
MKTLVHNYSSDISTEPMYLAQALENLGIKTAVWNNNISAFDIFDQFQPDLFISHANFLTNDIIKRIAGTNIEIILNCTDLDDMRFSQLQQILDSIKKKPRLLYKNGGSQTLFKIDPCADIFMSNNRIKSPKYSLDTLYIADSKESIDKYKSQIKNGESYHIFSPYRDFKELQVDTCLPLINLSNLYQNYKRIVVTKLSQVFYDAAYYGGSCEIFSEKSPVSLKKDVAKTQHTPYNRVSAMFSKIGEVAVAEKANEKVLELNA